MELLYWLESIRNPVLDAFFSVLTHLGSETLFMAIAIIVFWCVSKKNGYYLLTVGFLGTLLNQFLKLMCRIPRPWVRDPAFTIVEECSKAEVGVGATMAPSSQPENGIMAALVKLPVSATETK